MMLKSKLREPNGPGRGGEGMSRPLRLTSAKFGGSPRMLTNWPSPLLRVICTPVMRCRDSARFSSGNFPMSSAEIVSEIDAASRLDSMAVCRLARKPVTTTSSRVPLLAGTSAPTLADASSEQNPTDVTSNRSFMFPPPCYLDAQPGPVGKALSEYTLHVKCRFLYKIRQYVSANPIRRRSAGPTTLFLLSLFLKLLSPVPQPPCCRAQRWMNSITISGVMMYWYTSDATDPGWKSGTLVAICAIQWRR